MQEALIDKKKNFLERRRQVLYVDQKELDVHSTEIRKLDSQVGAWSAPQPALHCVGALCAGTRPFFRKV